MDRQEAFEVLGIDRQASKDEIRRAYLKLLRKHKPEVDPEGFKRLRQAYEVAREEPEPLVADAPASRAGEDADGAAAGGSAVSLREIFELRTYEVRIEKVSGDAPDAAAQRIAIAEEGVESHPDHPGLHLLLATEQGQAGQPEAAAETLRAAHAAGLPDMLDFLATRFPGQLSAEESEAWRESASPRQLLEAAEGSLVEGNNEHAAELFGLARERDRESMDGQSLAPMLLRFFVLVQAGGLGDLAEEADAWLATAIEGGALDAETRTELGAFWVIARELSSLHPSFPLHLRREIALALLRGQLSGAGDAMHEFAVEQPGEAVHAAGMLEATPNLFHFYHHLLSGPLSTTYSKDLPPAVSIGTIFVLILLIARCASDAPNNRRSGASIDAATVAAVRESLPQPLRAGISFQQCKSPVVQSRGCDLARRLDDELRRPRCGTALGTLREMAAPASEIASPPTIPGVPGGAGVPDRPGGPGGGSGAGTVGDSLLDWAMRSWSSECRDRLRSSIPEDSLEALAAYVEYCTITSPDYEVLGRCFEAAKLMAALESNDCQRARSHLESLDEGYASGDADSLEARAIAELGSFLDGKCAA